MIDASKDERHILVPARPKVGNVKGSRVRVTPAFRAVAENYRNTFEAALESFRVGQSAYRDDSGPVRDGLGASQALVPFSPSSVMMTQTSRRGRDSG